MRMTVPVLIGVCTLWASLGWSDSVRLCVGNTDFTPYLNPQGGGLFPELLAVASKRSGVDFEFVSLPWKRCLASVASGKLDAMAPLGWTKARGRQFAYPLQTSMEIDAKNRLWSGVYPVFVSRKSKLSWDGRRFRSVKFGLGAPLGYLTRERLASMKVLVKANLSLDQGLKLLSLDRLDGFVVEQHIGRRRAQQLNLELVELSPPFMVFPWYLVFSKPYAVAHEERVNAVWRALAEARAELAPTLVARYQLAPEIDY